MDGISSVMALLVIAISGSLLFWLRYRILGGRAVEIRPLKVFAALRRPVGPSVESGRRIHFGVGRASLAGDASPTSVAALLGLDYLAKDAAANDVPPITTVGDGTLLLGSQDSLRHAYARAGRQGGFSPQMARFVASGTDAMAYAGGVSDILNREGVGSNLMMGRFGSEVSIILEAAYRENMEQVIGTDDPVALAIAASSTEDILLGEELYAAGAYLEGTAAQLASLQLQDIMRIIVIVGILLAALINLVVG